MAGVAFFDLDRTLLPRASGPIFSRHLADHGVGVGGAAELAQPIADLFVWVYNEFGETWANMQLAKRLVAAASGWPVIPVSDAAESAAAEIAAEIPAFAMQLIDEHRAAGHHLVIATTSPTVFVRPLAERLGFDDVIGSVWAHDGQQFTGSLDGEFIWGPKKRDAVVEWAAAHSVSPRDCWAYSDSYYDGSMLDAVGHPVAVNPDARLAGVAALKGWKVRWFDAPEGVIKLAGREIQDWFRPFNRPELVPLADYDFRGVEHLPRAGPAIVAFNHRSYFDTVAMNLLVAQSGRPCRFLGKKEVFDAPIIGPLARAVGGIRVNRGTGSTALREAVKAISAGEMVAMAPQGTIPRGPAFFDPELKARKGVARLAQETGAPVIPVGLWGTEKVWPRNQRIPTIDLTSRPTVEITVGEPVKLGGTDLEADTATIMSAITALLPEQARQAYEPTDDELARTYPPGYSGDPDAEADRRPGTDT